jgi:hypothetical protein
MFSIIGKIWSIDEVLYGNGFFLRLILKKKKNQEQYSINMVIFKKEIIEYYQNRLFSRFVVCIFTRRINN